jgi:hypothetical protein
MSHKARLLKAYRRRPIAQDEYGLARYRDFCGGLTPKQAAKHRRLTYLRAWQIGKWYLVRLTGTPDVRTPAYIVGTRAKRQWWVKGN